MIINAAEFLVTLENKSDEEWFKNNISGGERKAVLMLGGHRVDAKVVAISPGRNQEGQVMAKVMFVKIAGQDKIVRVDWRKRQGG